MNYRHAFHAGNFADVVKHIVLTRVLVHLQDKPTAFRVIDTHAGAGLYDLQGDEARRGGEWQNGIGRLLRASLPADVAALVKPYLDVVAAFNSASSLPGGAIGTYPGSPLIARALLRPQDRLVACEIEPESRRQLIDRLRRDPQARVVDLDGWTALRAFVPPPERRGVVLIDPAFERPDEFERLAEGFAAAFEKWPGGTYLLWYPVKDRRAARWLGVKVAAALQRDKKSSGSEGCLSLEWSVRPEGENAGLGTAGLLIVHPPWTLERQLRQIMPQVARALGEAGAGRFQLAVPAA